VSVIVKIVIVRTTPQGSPLEAANSVLGANRNTFPRAAMVGANPFIRQYRVSGKDGRKLLDAPDGGFLPTSQQNLSAAEQEVASKRRTEARACVSVRLVFSASD
jgi:hypothetical protein